MHKHTSMNTERIIVYLELDNINCILSNLSVIRTALVQENNSFQNYTVKMKRKAENFSVTLHDRKQSL